MFDAGLFVLSWASTHWLKASALLVVCALAVRVLSAWWWMKVRRSDIPCVGSRLALIWSIFGIMKTRDLLEEGHEKYPEGLFQMPLFPNGTVVIANGTKLIEEMKNAPEEAFDFVGIVAPLIQSWYTLGSHIMTERYHTSILKITLTRNLAALFPDIAEEMKDGFTDALDLKGTEWKRVHAHSTIMEVVSRASNRVIVGAPICRDKEYQRLTIDFTIAVSKAAFFINLFPNFLHGLVGPLVTPLTSYRRAMSKYVKDLVEERQRCLRMYGSAWADKPNDYLMWLIEAAPPGIEQSVDCFSGRVLHINFAAIHTSSITFTHALLHLATHPELMKPLREEVERIIEHEGWTKASMQKMRKVDSFMRESSRLNTLGLTSIGRYVKKDYTFSNGVTVPKGSFMAASAYSAHLDPASYESAETFDPFRFSDIREDEKESTKHQMVATGSDYLPFGLGRHACPGRFFAANELKAMLCYSVMNYDVKIDGRADVPLKEYFGTAVIPKRDAHILVRRRVDV